MSTSNAKTSDVPRVSARFEPPASYSRNFSVDDCDAGSVTTLHP